MSATSASHDGRFDSVFRPGLFEDKVILVTGGGTGIGRCIAHELAALGGLVIVAARREEPLLETVAEIENDGGLADHAILNIRDDEAVDAEIARLVEKHGRIDGLVNNAGGQFAAPAALIRPKGWRAVIDTNLNGTWYVSQSVFKHSMAAKGGNIVSVVADMWTGFPGMAHTGAARSGVVNLTMTLAQEWACCGIRVNAVAPGYILSSGLLSYPEDVQRTAARAMPQNPTSRIGTESEVSAAVAFLLSPAAAFINGDTIRVDGGGSLRKEGMLPMPSHDAIGAWDGFHRAPELPDIFKPDSDAE